MAPAHIAHGSIVANSSQSPRRWLPIAVPASRNAMISACAVGSRSVIFDSILARQSFRRIRLPRPPELLQLQTPAGRRVEPLPSRVRRTVILPCSSSLFLCDRQRILYGMLKAARDSLTHWFDSTKMLRLV